MDGHERLLIIKGEDKTDSVASYRFEGGKCHVRYSNAPREYDYNSYHVQILELRRKIDPKSVIVVAKGRQVIGVEEIRDFGSFYRIVRKDGKNWSYYADEVRFLHNCLSEERTGGLFGYFKETAAAVSLVMENGTNILSQQYQKITSVQDDTVLSSYLELGKEPRRREAASALIYPFGLNQSQKRAVENAFSSQVSIIQGPPGTGKTQTILNIIANAVLRHKTVAVVSSNNTATLNVARKLEKKGVSFLTASLGNRGNREKFLDGQSGQYPDMSEWELAPELREELSESVKSLSTELNEMLNRKNRVAEIERELLELQPEQYHFNEYYATFAGLPDGALRGLTSGKILSLWLEYEHHAEQNDKLGLLKKLSILFRFNRSALDLFLQAPELVIPYLQSRFYVTKKAELQTEKAKLEKELADYSFDEKMEELSQRSLQLFRAELARRYCWRGGRRKFQREDLYGNAAAFNQEYPVVLSTTYSIKKTLGIEHVYDYLIVDEASQVDLATGVLAFSCAKNVVIVGDLKQLPNVMTGEDIQTAEKIWSRRPFEEIYHFTKQSLLSSAVARWRDVPSVLLREHYRCHPKIIGFCNQKFYQGQLIVMTEDHGEDHVLTMYRTAAGNHARGHLNQRQIDVIQKEVLPFLEEEGYQDIGIITPYRDQVEAVEAQLGPGYEVDTVHKFQGREKGAIVLTSVDNVIGDFVDDPHMLNVAVSRAVKALVVVMSRDPRNDKTNYGDLARYIGYNNCEIIDSSVFSVFDLLYEGYARQRREYLQKHRRVSDYDSENLLYAVIEGILKKEEFQKVGCAVHVSLAALVKDYTLLDEEEKAYARNLLTHTDFLLFNKMDKSPIMAIEVDGARFHKAGSKQAARDAKKDRIFPKCGIPLLRVRTDESGEESRIESALKLSV